MYLDPKPISIKLSKKIYWFQWQLGQIPGMKVEFFFFFFLNKYCKELLQQGLLLHQLITSTGSHLSGHFYKPSKNFLPACSLVTFTPKAYKEHSEKDSKQEMKNFV